MSIFIVTEFGCNSGHNDMYPPNVSVFLNRDDAYVYYNTIKKTIVDMKEMYDIEYEEYTQEDQESIIQTGGKDGAKRPIGVMISVKDIRALGTC